MNEYKGFKIGDVVKHKKQGRTGRIIGFVPDYSGEIGAKVDIYETKVNGWWYIFNLIPHIIKTKEELVLEMIHHLDNKFQTRQEIKKKSVPVRSTGV